MTDSAHEAFTGFLNGDESMLRLEAIGRIREISARVGASPWILLTPPYDGSTLVIFDDPGEEWGSRPVKLRLDSQGRIRPPVRVMTDSGAPGSERGSDLLARFMRPADA